MKLNAEYEAFVREIEEYRKSLGEGYVSFLDGPFDRAPYPPPGTEDDGTVIHWPANGEEYEEMKRKREEP